VRRFQHRAGQRGRRARGEHLAPANGSMLSLCSRHQLSWPHTCLRLTHPCPAQRRTCSINLLPRQKDEHQHRHAV
jgi:hypothetical protein